MLNQKQNQQNLKMHFYYKHATSESTYKIDDFNIVKTLVITSTNYNSQTTAIMLRVLKLEQLAQLEVSVDLSKWKLVLQERQCGLWLVLNFSLDKENSTKYITRMENISPNRLVF